MIRKTDNKQLAIDKFRTNCLLSITTCMLFIGTFLYSPFAYGQACPACSNPALQSSEKLEAGIDTLHRGAFRFTLNVTNGYDYHGGHPNVTGLSTEGEIIDVPLHEHIVSLDFFRYEASMEYTFATNWSTWLRIPYDIKMQTASIEFTEPVTEYEKEAILRNRDIHHRNETYSGLSDLRLLVARRINKFLGEDGQLDVAFGISLPVGETEEDPLEAGNEGIKHLHIQFGTGTFDPLLEFHFTTSLSEKMSLAIFSMNKLPFYDNSKGYSTPIETTTGIGAGYLLRPWLTLRGTFANFSQTQATWNGLKDPNSGLVSFNGSITTTFLLKNGLGITPGYRFPVLQKTLSDEGDVFEYGPTFLLNVSYLFNN